MGIPAFAEEMVLTLTVPEQHTVSIESPGGRIVADGAVCGAQVEIQRHKHSYNNGKDIRNRLSIQDSIYS